MVVHIERRFAFSWLVALALVALSTRPSAQPPQSRMYPAAKQGGNYMYNYYFAPAPSSTPLGARVVAGRPMDRGRHERIDLARRSENGPGRGVDLQPPLSLVTELVA
jgi:hypothetical protein